MVDGDMIKYGNNMIIIVGRRLMYDTEDVGDSTLNQMVGQREQLENARVR